MIIGNKNFETDKHTYVMGIMNITPDSFSDGGLYNSVDKALQKAQELIKDGADILDIGGESTRPGFITVSVEEQIERVIPVIEKIKNNFDIPLSIDTYKAEVAYEAVNAGCVIVNDIWALRDSKKMAQLVADRNLTCVLMHNREKIDYDNFRANVLSDLSEYVENAVKNGISKNHIIVDPGIGFGKTYEQNLSMIHYIDDLHDLGCPILMGTSRKSVIGLTLDLPIFERAEGTIATTVLACMKGVGFVRVHDVKENVRAIRMTEAILNS